MPKCQNHNRNTISRIFFGHARLMGVNHRTWCSWEEFLKQQQAISLSRQRKPFLHSSMQEVWKILNLSIRLSIDAVLRYLLRFAMPIISSQDFPLVISPSFSVNRTGSGLSNLFIGGPTIMEFALRKAGLLPACLEGSK